MVIFESLLTSLVIARQDLDGLVLFARRRARDEKGSVRKSGMLLLEILLVMGVRGLGGASLQLPAVGDLELIEAATMDPLVKFCFHLILDRFIARSGSRRQRFHFTILPVRLRAVTKIGSEGLQSAILVLPPFLTVQMLDRYSVMHRLGGVSLVSMIT